MSTRAEYDTKNACAQRLSR